MKQFFIKFFKLSKYDNIYWRLGKYRAKLHIVPLYTTILKEYIINRLPEVIENLVGLFQSTINSNIQIYIRRVRNRSLVRKKS